MLAKGYAIQGGRHFKKCHEMHLTYLSDVMGKYNIFWGERLRENNSGLLLHFSTGIPSFFQSERKVMDQL